jgi:asparagine synthase (glutamine-hydrolysing)
MCGIAGQFHLHNKRVGSSVTPIKAVDIEKMCQAMQHRGPNQQAVRLWKHGGFGFRRLSIIDLSDNGQQPMANEDESLWLIFNGEIYNYRSLRDELQKLGHRFRSDTDSEVVLHGFEAWGKKLLDKIEGMYAFALYRPDDHYLLLVRDPFGIKPLYYYQNQQQLIFASEIRPLLKYEFIKPQLDRSQLFHYFTLGYVPNPNTMFVGIHKLPPGHYLELHNEKIALQRYWDLQEHKNSATLQESLQSLDVNLKKNLQQSLISDVPLGVFLSGGLDSTLLTFYSQSVSQEKLKTFAIGFKDNPHFDETKKSDYVAKTLQTDQQNQNRRF